MNNHYYIERHSGSLRKEVLLGHEAVRFLYSGLRENSRFLFDATVSPRVSKWLAFLNYDSFIGSKILGNRRFLQTCGINGSECVEDPRQLDTLKKIFERKIRYWECRPMPEDRRVVVSPADSRMVCGSLSERSAFFIKGKFFDLEELLGADKGQWQDAFTDGEAALFRLTPEKYHYNHTPVAGKVVDFYALDGACHSCNPYAVTRVSGLYSKNKRVVTIIDTDVEGGTGVGLVAMIEIVALMIGGIEQRYSRFHYQDPLEVRPGISLERGCPKSVFKPGSSTVVLLFEKNRLAFSDDIIANMNTPGVESFLNDAFGGGLVETDVPVRSAIGRALPPSRAEG